jgi:ABC-2 type transport system permease protein
LYSTIYAVIGAICTTEKEAQNFHFPIIIALILPVIIGFRVMQDPNATLPVVLSFIPFFTPTMMMMRVSFIAPSMGEFSFFSDIMLQVLAGFVLVMLTTMAVTWVAGRIFRVGVLMYGKRATLSEVIKWVKY